MTSVSRDGWAHYAASHFAITGNDGAAQQRFSRLSRYSTLMPVSSAIRLYLSLCARTKAANASVDSGRT